MAVIEPTPDQLDAFNGLDDVLAWASLDGPTAQPGTLAGSLMRLLGVPIEVDQWEAMCRFANIDPEDFKEELQHWNYASDGGLTLDSRPSATQRGYARAAYNAARIRAGITRSRFWRGPEKQRVSGEGPGRLGITIPNS